MKAIATGIYTFGELIGRRCVYVDKTRHLQSLIESEGDKQYFMARPRRFGKSLAISTLQASAYTGQTDGELRSAQLRCVRAMNAGDLKNGSRQRCAGRMSPPMAEVKSRAGARGDESAGKESR